jgi:hypothetical protein
MKWKLPADPLRGNGYSTARITGALIRKAEDRVNAIGSKGNYDELASACNAWLAAWREGIRNWKYRSLK